MKKITIILLAVISAFACKKTDSTSFLDEIDGKQFSKSTILNSTDSITGIAEDTIPIIPIIPQDCKKDNIWTFKKSNKSFKLDEGPTKCNPADAQTKDEGVIEELNNGTQLKVAGTGTNEIWNIESRTASSFQVSYFAKNASNKTVKFRVTFTQL